MSNNEILIEIEQDKIEAVDSQVLRANLDRLIALVQQLGQDSAGGLALDEVAVSVKITPEGKVALLGHSQSTGAMTLRFKRPIAAIEQLPVTSVGINYNRLTNLLAAHKWQDANQETWDLLCQALNKQKGSHLSIADINLIPCQTLNAIDQLWQTHSQGRYGFTVQKRLYDSIK